MPAPEPCPYCGSRPLLREIMGKRDWPTNVYEFYCPVCGMSSGFAFSPEEAGRKWKVLVQRQEER